MNGWGAGGHALPFDPWTLAGRIGAAVFVLVLVWIVVRALVQHARYRAVGTLNAADVDAVRAALARAEKRTVGEILPVVVERSDPHPGAEWLAALSFLLAGSSLLMAWLPWRQPAALLLAQLAIGALGFGLARALPGLKRLFLDETRATAVAEEQALQEFYRHGLHRTQAATGVLLFVSLFERRAIVLADEGIDRRVAADFWAETDRAVLDGIRRGSLRDGLIAGIERVGERLAEQFPWGEGDRDEIPDRVVVRRE
jgi:putative membrane protein